MPNGLAEGFFQGVQLHPRHRPRRRLAVAYTEDASGRLEFGRGTLPPYERARGRRNLPVSAPPAPDAPPTIDTTFRRRDRSVNMAKSRQTVPNPRSRRTARTMITATQCRCARTLLRWSVSKLSSAASVSQCDIDDFELERRQPNAITTDAIRRAFEGVGVVFLAQDDVQLRSNVSATR
jgi:hypothetical protein